MAPDRIRFSWRLEGPGRTARETAYQVLVTQGGEPAGWDSGRVASACSADIAYRGDPLARGGRYSWRVRVWDEDQAVSEWSEPASFEVELDPAGGWRASWIGLGRIREDFRAPTGTGPPDPLGMR